MRKALIAAWLFGLLLLTRPDHKPVWIVDSSIVAISSAIEGDTIGKTQIVTGSGTFFVMESPEAVAKRLGKAR